MAISTSFSNFSFFSPQTKPPLPLLSQFPSHHHNPRNSKIIPLVLSRNETTSSSITSSPPPPPPPPPPKDVSADFPNFTSSSLYSTSHYNVEVVLEDDEPEERMLNRFRREVLSAGILQECRRRKHFENKQDEKKRRIRETALRNRRLRRPTDGNSPGGRFNNYWQDDPTPEEEEDDDVWDLPEEDVLRF